MYANILVPLDGSKRAETILSHVENVATRFGSQVIFLKVVESFRQVVGGDFVYIDPSDYEARKKEAEDYLLGMKARFHEKGIESRTRIVNGPVVEAIIENAEQVNADLIAIASHGRGGLSRVFYGSVAAGVLHRVDRPLLLIRSA
jgi:nucleotide-binding universal stress UspA family protein